MQRRWVGVLAVCSAVVWAAGNEAPTAQALMELATQQAARDAGRGKEPVPTGLLLAVMDQAKGLLSSEGVPLDGAAEEWLREQVLSRLEAELARVPKKAGAGRRDAWERLMRRAMTAQLAQQVLDAALGLQPPEELKDAAVSGTWTQVTQLEGAETFALQGVGVVEELGSPGSANTLIDPGEWVQLSLSFTNASKMPWFSTTGVAQVQGCGWTDPARGSLLGEAGPGQSASLSLWLYFPDDCTTPSVLRISLSDTHRGSPPRTIALEVRPMGFTRPRATKLRLDTDPLGSSDGSQRDRIAPSQRFELVTDLVVPGELVTGVNTRWAIAAPARALFASLTFRPEPSVPLGNGLFSASDDLDGVTVDEDTWVAAARASELEPWLVVPAPGRLWFALDSVVTLTAPPPAPPAPSLTLGKPTGMKSAASSTSAASRLSSAVPAPVSAVSRLVQQYVTLVPHSVPREQPGAVIAATGYEVLFDQEAFAKAYEALITPAAQEPAPTRPAARYLARTYVAVAAVPAKRYEPEPLPEPKPQPPLRRRPAPAPAPERREANPLVQLDVGAGVTLYPTAPTAAQPLLWLDLNPAPLPTFDVRAFIGPSVVGMAAFHLAFFPYSLGARAQFLEVSGELGVGYRAHFAPLTLTPYAALYARLRSHSLLSDVWMVGGLLGLNARVALTPAFGLALDLGVPLTMGGPLGRSSSGLLVDTMGGIGFRSTLNLSFRF